MSFTRSVIPVGAVLFVIAGLLAFPERLGEARWPGGDPVPATADAPRRIGVLILLLLATYVPALTLVQLFHR